MIHNEDLLPDCNHSSVSVRACASLCKFSSPPPPDAGVAYCAIICPIDRERFN